MASATLTFRRLVLVGSMLESISRRLIPISSIPCPEKISTMGVAWDWISSSISRSSIFPALSWARSLSFVAWRDASGETSSSVWL